LGNSIDVREIDGASNNSVAEARELIETIRYAASSSRYKVYIIDEVHMLSKSAFNALLKTLEEPPSKVVFLFATQK
jgi:DNA polymerase-3 subunit gamma/tau